MSAIRAVYFDVGETLIDETRQWGLWADWLGIPHLTFFAVFGAVVERGEHHRRTFDYFEPGFDVAEETRRRAQAGKSFVISPNDFYPDAMPCLADLRRRGLKIGIAGNQPDGVEQQLRDLGVAADYLASSASWGIEKPSVRFFERIAEQCGMEPHRIAYVGDRLDNDILPALAYGFRAILIERGPWGKLHARLPEAAKATAVIQSLNEVAGLLERLA